MDAEFLDLIYASIIDNRLWGDVLQRVSDGMGGEGAALVWQDVTTNVPGGVFNRLDPESLKLFTSYFATRNPLRPSAAEIRRLLPGWTPHIVLDEDRLTKDDFLKTEFYNDYFRRFGYHSSAAIGLQVEGIYGGTLDVLKSVRRGAFTETELRFAKDAQPHLIRAFRLSREVRASMAADRDAALALDRSTSGLFVLTLDGGVRHMNDAAESFVTKGDALRILDGRLIATDHHANRRLSSLIGMAASPDAALRSGGFMTVEPPSLPLPLTISVTPAPVVDHPIFDVPSVFVRVTDPQRVNSPSPDKLREVFRLTAAETRVALALFEGLQTPEVADRMGSSVSTIRNHLARVFDKTKSSGQAELSRRLMSLL